jgi:hypothetical protein
VRIIENKSDLIAFTDSPAPITKEQVMKHTRFHFTGDGPCFRIFGPKGRVTDKTVQVRESGKVQTWKTRPTHFRAPVKYGMYTSGAIRVIEGQDNTALFHTEHDCPLNGPDFPKTRAEVEALLAAQKQKAALASRTTKGADAPIEEFAFVVQAQKDALDPASLTYRAYRAGKGHFLVIAYVNVTDRWREVESIEGSDADDWASRYVAYCTNCAAQGIWPKSLAEFASEGTQESEARYGAD